MRVQTEEWRRFIPGVRMYKGEMTLFYNGEILWAVGVPLVHDVEERCLWEVIIILPGVEVIPWYCFNWCTNLKTVIMSDSVKRIERQAFFCCMSLEFVKLSRNLEFIADNAFYACHSLSSIFIPPSCTEIGNGAFCDCIELLILGLPQHVELGENVFGNTALIKKSPFELDVYGYYFENNNEEEVVQWIRSINNEGAYALHRACASYNPLSEIIHDLVKRQGINAMKTKNAIGITPSQYLEANTFSNISEKEIVNRYILDIMGETA